MVVVLVAAMELAVAPADMMMVMELAVVLPVVAAVADTSLPIHLYQLKEGKQGLFRIWFSSLSRQPTLYFLRQI